MQKDFDRTKSLQELEQSDWGEPTYDSYLVRTVHSLRRKPLQDFTIEDLRIIIGQELSLDYLMPLAIEQLEANPLAEGHYWQGDLLTAVLRQRAEFWHEHPHLIPIIDKIVARAEALIEEMSGIDRENIEDIILGSKATYEQRKAGA